MGVFRRRQTPVAFLSLAFSLVALGILPTALCCEAIAEGSAEVCPHLGMHGDGETCPMHQPKPADSADGCVKIRSCSTGDPLVAGLLTLTGALPETAQTGTAEFVARPLPRALVPSIDLLERQPHTPPPRV